MKALLFLSSTWKRYLAFIVWGIVQGAIQYSILIRITPSRLADDLGPLDVSIFCGGIISAIVFGLLSKAPRWLQTLGFLIVGALTPSVVIIARIALHFHTYLDPVTILIIFLWTVYSLPFAMFAAAVYFFVWLALKRKQDKASSATSSTPSAEPYS